MTRLAIDALVSFSTIPLHFAIYAGFSLAVLDSCSPSTRSTSDS